jgi:predicted CXXCH cytochrome family protein
MKHLAVILVLALAAAAGGEPASRPTTVIGPEGCVTDACHTRIKSFKVTHGPAASNACDACHELTDAARHSFKRPRDKAEMCTYCHDFNVKGMNVVHKPVAEGQCLGCHDPHGGDTHALIREASTAELCQRCHGETTKGKSVLHSPVKQGACDSCHPPHASKFPKLLDVVGTDLCLTCHTELEPKLSAAKFKHKAMNDGCQKCHDVHGSSHPLATTRPTTELCLGCHEQTKDTIAKATVAHSPVTSGRSCINCHTPHAGDHAKLTTDSPAVTCLNCHEKPIKYNGTTVNPVKEIADAKLHKHGDLKDGQCGSCHTVHGGANPTLLQKVYSTAFYQKFDPQNYALCFGCHDQKLATEAKTTVTGFRNGDVNLHYVHANQGNRDKNCRACHETHAAGNTRLVRETLPYGVWTMPMRFSKSDTGGTCFPGCHAEWGYDRVKPLANTTQPTSRPVEAIERSQHQDEQIVNWTTLDEAGKTITVPDQKRPALLLFVQDDAANAVKDIAPLVRADQPLQVIVIAVGKVDVQPLRQVMPKDWSLVLDPTNDTADAVGVRGRPLVLVLRPDGKQVVRLSASTSVLALKLQPYIDLAAGRIKAVEHVATHPAIEEPAKKAARDLRAVRELIDAGKPQPAIDLLAQYDSHLQSSAPAKILRAEAQIALGKPLDALRTLDSIGKVKNTSPDEVIVRARAWVALNEWRAAQAVLEDNLAQLKDSAAGHQLLGEIFERGQAYKQAAEHYRLASEIRSRQK